MEGPSRKRPLPEDDDDSNKLPPPKRVRFPKGKKVKTGDHVVDERYNNDVPIKLTDPRIAAKERAKRRSEIADEMFDQDNRGMIHDISRAEVQYESNETFTDDGIQIEPFNLSKEREEGYFDAAGNYVEYVNENEIKDAWLDSIDAHQNFSANTANASKIENEDPDLSSEDIGTIKRRIADILQPGETVLQALRRLKGTSNSKKEKMPEETKKLFDQLTEDAMRLLENGDYDVYDEKKETFQREAEGYERLAAARRQGASTDLGAKKPDIIMNNGKASSVFDSGPSNKISASAGIGSDFDMFAEDDEKATVNPVSDVNAVNPNGSGQPSESGELQNDYVFDESSGYYYSSSLGYYYDPSSGLYCCAASGQWYSYNAESGTYDEVQQATSNVS
ncbi:hypothetical protein M9H77_20724 [Catharanthus roseus]|uniref:Uncharacterized protein n=1 Tax=Catharanthus roseus TaxID=4058 RepID=A0ACC0ALD3_CATRO|nr:hypothetical protein M9H77_20724 [Catharanthus roseus]